jgi:hypothetical protein
VGTNNPAAVPSSIPHSFESLLGRKPLLKKVVKFFRAPSQTPIRARKEAFGPTQKRGGDFPTPNFACSLLSSSPKQQKKFSTRSFELIITQ